jgi:hypothetical protein
MAATPETSDHGYRLILAGVCLVATWLLAMPLSRVVQQTTLNRYHLQTGSFIAWAVQAPVPAMYNFHNRYRVEAPSQQPPPDSAPLTGALNHFPIRLYTFGETRRFMLRDRARHMLTAESHYRGLSLTTRWQVVVTEDGAFELIDQVVP